jgi:hypothetical protein
VPSLGSTQASQPFAVQPEAMVLLATQRVVAPVPQAWEPAGQVTPQVMPLHEAVPLGGVAHAVQPVIVHPEATLLLATQVSPHRW